MFAQFGQTSLIIQKSLALDIVIHIHQIPNRLDVVRDIGVTPDGVLDRAACHGKVGDIHRFIVVHHGVNQSACKGVAAAHAVQDIEGKQAAFKGVVFVPQEGFQAVFTAAVGIAHMAGNAFQIRVSGGKRLKDFILLVIAWL